MQTFLKKEMSKLFLIFTILLFGFNPLLADGDAIPPKGKIKGAVVDKSSKEPLEYATVALYEVEGSKLVSGTITDHLGHFRIDQPEKGSYYLLITFIGLKEQQTEPFDVGDDHHNLNLGNFFLKSASEELGEIEVVGKRASIEYKIDKKVINVDKQITSEAGNAVDILENVPSVQVDVEGNVSLRGSTGFTVLIDGKPTILDPSDALRQIPSSSIENIEIITNPSVKFEPDGATGIINIITKKNRLDGLSGIVNANAGMYGQYGGDFQLSYRMSKFNFIVGANYNRRTRPGYVTNERTTLSNDTTYFVNSSGERDRERISSGIRAGIEYSVSKNDFISLAGRFGRWDMNNNSLLRYDDWTDPATELFSYNSIDGTVRGGNFYSLDGVYQHNFAKKIPKKTGPTNATSAKGGMGKEVGKEVGAGKSGGFKPTNIHMIKFQIMYRNRSIDESTTNELRDLSDNLIGGKKNVENGPSASTRIKVDYTLPIGRQDKFEAGMQWRSGKSQDITELWLYDPATGDINFIDDFSNSTDYYRNIYAAYALYAGTVGKFGYQGGLRTEYTDRKIEMTGEDAFTINRWDFFPTIHFSYNLPHDQQLMASYSRRIDRPRSWWLEPFVTWQDAYNVRQGNPALQPEYIDSYDVGYLKRFGDNFFSLEGYYRVTHNKVERVSSVYQDNVMLHRPENVGEDYSLGIEVMLNLGLFKWWDMEISGNFFNYKLDGELTYIQADEITVEELNRTSTNWNTRFNNTFRLWKNGVFQVNSRYNSASITAQGTSSGFFTLDAAFKVTFLNRSLSANLQGRDILGTSMRERKSEGPDFYSHYKYDPKSPVVVLTLSYRFNNFKTKRGGQGGNDEDEF